MKRISIIIFLIFLSFPAFADTNGWWYGGPARMASLGEIQTALPDLTNAQDLYEFGFPTAFLWRDSRNIIDISSNLELAAWPGARFYNNFGTGYNFLGVWLTDCDFIVLTPNYQRINVADLTSDYLVNLSGSYAHRFSNDMGISVGMIYGKIDDGNPVYVLSRTEEISVEAGLDKFLGKLNIPYLEDFVPVIDLAAKIGFNAFRSLTIWNMYWDENLNAELGLSAVIKQKFNVILSVGKAFLFRRDSRLEISFTESREEELQLYLNCKAGLYLLDWLLATARITGAGIDKFVENAGLSLLLPGFSLPMEYIKDNTDGYKESYGGGIEWNVSKLLDVRAGARQNGNPGLNASYYTDYTAGFGLNIERFDFNFAAIYCPDTAGNYIFNKYTKITADMKCIF